MNGGTR